MACSQQASIRIPHPTPISRQNRDRAHLGIRFFHLGSPDMRSQRHAVRASLFPHRCHRVHYILQDGGVFVARLTFVRSTSTHPLPPFHSHHYHYRSLGTASALRLPPLAIQDEIRPTLVPPQQYVTDPHPIPFPVHPFQTHVRAVLTANTVYPDGTVCISILHTPGDDPTMYEQASERWSPVQSVEKVLLSVISMLAGMPSISIPPICGPVGANTHSVEPNLESGANIDCCKLYRENKPVRTVFRIRDDSPVLYTRSLGIRATGERVH